MLIARKVKGLFVRSGQRPRRILAGPFNNIHMLLDLTTQTQLYLGLIERETYRDLRKLSHGINSAIDIGAAFGQYTLFFLLKTSAQKVVAVDPSLQLAEQFDTNLMLNNLKNSPKLKVLRKYVSHKNTEYEVTLDTILAELSEPCLIKMDVDGAEVNILNASHEILKHSNIRWLIETHSESLENECIQILAAANYHVRIIPNAWWRFIIPEQRVSSQNRWLVAEKNKLIYDV